MKAATFSIPATPGSRCLPAASTTKVRAVSKTTWWCGRYWWRKSSGHESRYCFHPGYTWPSLLTRGKYDEATDVCKKPHRGARRVGEDKVAKRGGAKPPLFRYRAGATSSGCTPTARCTSTGCGRYGMCRPMPPGPLLTPVSAIEARARTRVASVPVLEMPLPADANAVAIRIPRPIPEALERGKLQVPGRTPLL